MPLWIKVVGVAIASGTVLVVLGLVVLTLFYSNPRKTLTYHALQDSYTSLTVALPVEVVREKIIRLFDPFSTLVSQPTPEQRQAYENMELVMNNLECLTLIAGDTEKQAKCEALAQANLGLAIQPTAGPGTDQVTFDFTVKAGSELRRGYDGDEPYNYNIRSLVFAYETRGLMGVDTVLKKYLTQDEKMREHDLWLAEDATSMSMDNSRSSSLKESELEKFRPTGEYMYRGRSVVGTSDYILQIKPIDVMTTEVVITPLLPRVLAGTRFESGCHAFYCPRFVHDLRPVNRFDEERAALREYLSTHLK